MLKGLLLIIAIVVFSILAILSFIFSIIFFINSKKGKFGWLGGFLFSLTGLIISVIILVNGLMHKASSLAKNMEQSFSYSSKNFFERIDTSGNKAHLISDSLSNKQIEYLKSLESEDNKKNVPQQFYHYLGFGDYYRLPLKYPFSLHCTDSLGNASLYNEIGVNRFDENDNGEKDCGIYNISEFVFDDNMLIAKRNYSEKGKQKTTFIIYYFETEKSEEIENLQRLNLKIKNIMFSKPVEFINCRQYFELF